MADSARFAAFVTERATPGAVEDGQAVADILVVDDKPGDLLAIQAVLGQPDYNLITAATGAEALRRVLERDFAVILLDVRLPDIPGDELAAIIKQRDRSRFTPIIFLTAATTDVREIYRAYQVGAVDYLAKPIDADILRAKVGIFVELFRKDQRIAAQAAALTVASERRYRNLAEAIPQIVWTAGAGGEVTYFNRRWFEYTGRPAGAVDPKWFEVIHPDEVERYHRQWDAARGARRVFEQECQLRRADGAYRWYLCRAIPEQDDRGEVVGWLGTFTDFDARRRAFDAAHAAVRARDEFLSIASHELRTPLMTLRLRLDSLAQESPSKAVAAAIRQTDRLTDLVGSLLDVSRIATGRLSIEPREFDLVQAVEEVLEQFRETAARAGCTLQLDAPAPVLGQWDRPRVEQIVQNLVDNAIKYAPRSPVEIDVHGQDDGAVVSIADHGIGIAPEDAERVFGQFERAVSAQHYGGLGMGLYIARALAMAHGGNISVDSAPGVGSKFTVTLPTAPPESAR